MPHLQQGLLILTTVGIPLVSKGNPSRSYNLMPGGVFETFFIYKRTNDFAAKSRRIRSEQRHIQIMIRQQKEKETKVMATAKVMIHLRCGDCFMLVEAQGRIRFG